jgi:hypothetical protein
VYRSDWLLARVRCRLAGPPRAAHARAREPAADEHLPEPHHARLAPIDAKTGGSPGGLQRRFKTGVPRPPAVSLLVLGSGGVDGTRTLERGVSKRLMARDFWAQHPPHQSLVGSLSFTTATSNPLKSTRVVETCWRRQDPRPAVPVLGPRDARRSHLVQSFVLMVTPVDETASCRGTALKTAPD